MLQTTKDRYDYLKANNTCVSCGKNPIKFGRSKIRCTDCLESNRRKPLHAGYIEGLLKNRERRRKLKLEVFKAYGGPRCYCCGETELMFLELDHRYNDGAAHRALKLHSKDPYQWAKANNFPPVFQVLCSNCNHGKQKSGGICPHKLNKIPVTWKAQDVVNIPITIGTASLCFKDDAQGSYAITFKSPERAPADARSVTKIKFDLENRGVIDSSPLRHRLIPRCAVENKEQST